MSTNRPFCLRPSIDRALLDRELAVILRRLQARIAKHGDGCCAGPHEVLGIMLEEVREVEDAVRENKDLVDELRDVAVACIFGAASLIQRERQEDGKP